MLTLIMKCSTLVGGGSSGGDNRPRQGGKRQLRLCTPDPETDTEGAVTKTKENRCTHTNVFVHQVCMYCFFPKMCRA